jgi:geranylgeranyl diphosphate synthase, type II
MPHHAIYLAIIALLIIIIVYAAARAIKARRTMREVEERFGLREGIRSSVPRTSPLRELSADELLAPRTYEAYKKEMDDLIARALELKEFGDMGQLTSAIAHSLTGGKRLRPIIIMEICRASTLSLRSRSKRPRDVVPLTDPADAALFIEYLHTASLVIDDLPAFDDDSQRRGKPSAHTLTTPAVAHMAALSMVSAAFQNICRQVDWIRDNCPEFKTVDQIGTRLCHDVSRALGAMGAAGGQFMDSSVEGDRLFRDYGPDAVMDIMRLKTATFFEISFLAGWLISGAPSADAEDIQRAGRYFGVAFQIADDLGDMEQDAARKQVGKPGWNFANHYGEEEARHHVTKNLNACRLILQEKGLFTPLWKEIYKKVWEMAG